MEWCPAARAMVKVLCCYSRLWGDEGWGIDGQDDDLSKASAWLLPLIVKESTLSCKNWSLQCLHRAMLDQQIGVLCRSVTLRSTNRLSVFVVWCPLAILSSSWVFVDKPPVGPLSCWATNSYQWEQLRLWLPDTVDFILLSKPSALKILFVFVINKWIWNHIKPVHNKGKAGGPWTAFLGTRPD